MASFSNLNLIPITIWRILLYGGDFTWRVSDWWRHLRKHLGRNATNYFKYLMGRYKRAPPLIIKLFQLLHLNQAGVQHLICDLTDAHASTL